MGITPIANLAPLPLARTIQPDLDPLPMERVENTSRTRDETYSPSGGGASARGSEDDAPENDGQQPDDEAGGEPSVPPGIPPGEAGQPRPISFFA